MKRVIVLIMVAIVLATATGVSSYYYLQNAEQHVMAGLETVTVLQTNGSIPAGTSYATAVSQGLVGPVDVPSKFAVASMLRPGTSVTGSLVAGRDLPAGRLLFTGDFLATAETNRILPIPSGDVAVSFTLPVANRLAPFLNAGDHVAVLQNRAATATTQAAPEVVFNDVLVLAVGNTSAMGAGNGIGADGLVTVAVPLADAPTLVKAVNSGSIYLAMLSSTVGAN
ncbi:MAG: Flp pilus assembly protein CpaB [Candidatus Nanopelagicales bacterium]